MIDWYNECQFARAEMILARAEIERVTAARDAAMRVHMEDQAEIERQRQQLIMRFNEAEEAAAEIKRLTEERDDARAAQLAAERTNAPLLVARAEIERLTRRVTQLGVLVEALADDLEAELNGRYPQNVRDYPSEQRRFERDMANVYEARRALESEENGHR